MRLVVAALRLLGYRVNAYVDDFASTGRGPQPSTAAAATAGRRDILQLFRRLVLQVHPTKGEAVGTTRLPLLGFLIDTTRQVVVLPAARLTKLVTGAKVLLSEATRRSWRVSSWSLQQFSGMTVSCYLAIPSALFRRRRLYDVTRPKIRVSRLSHGAARDLRWFTMLEQEPGVGRALWPSTLGTLTTDASPYGWGGHWQHLLPAAGFFSAAQRDLHINVKEVAAVRFCLLAFGSQLLGEEGLLQLRVDSRVAMHVINGFSSRSPVLMAGLRNLHEVALLYRVALRASWLPSMANVWADTLSRKGDRDDWRLSDEMFTRLQLRYGCHTVDRFATPLNALCPRFNTKMHAPVREFNWVNPPFSQAARVLNKVYADKATETVILPV